MKRRTFIRNSSIAFSALPLFPATFSAQNYKIALVGSGWWGMNILTEAMAYGSCKVVGLCDVDQKMLQAANTKVQNLKGDRPKSYKDYREMITKEKPDIVIVGTPDHWHAHPTIFAVQNGAHVYLEKPISHTIEEGQLMLQAARKYNKKVQVGTHRRLSDHNIAAMDFLKSGKAGEIMQVKTFVNYQQGPGEKRPDQEPPEGLDWDFWVGPAPMRQFNPGIHPLGFREYLDFANGQIANWGIHWFDQVLWWTEEKYPKSVYSTGGIYVKDDGSDAPDTQLATFAFEGFTMEWEHKLNAHNYNEDHQLGTYFYGTEGTFHLGWIDGWTFYPRGKNKTPVKMASNLHDPDFQNIKESWADFIMAIENDHLPTCDIKSGHIATTMSLLGMISLKTGRSITWDGENELIKDDEEASKLMSKAYRKGWELPVV